MNLWLPAGALVVALLALTMVLASYRLATRERWMAAAFAVAVAALLLRGYAVSERALNPWDERYHALVAKHLIEQPLAPTLYRDPAPSRTDHADWYSNRVWLHKPPLALWSQAASMGIFGVAELPMRLPSLLFATASVLVTFGIGCLLFSPSVGLTAAVFHAFNGFLVDLGLGRRASDHVDTLLVLLVALGVLGALAADRRWPRATGVILGLACGLAYLTKSAPGLLLLPIWLLIRWQVSSRRGLTREFAIAGGVALLIAFPWTIYVLVTFPLEARHESAYTLRHMSDVLENHGGPPWRYVGDMPRFFGELIYLPMAVAMVLAWRGSASPALRAMLLWLALPYALFSMMATKMPAYIALAAPAIFLIQADVWLAIQRRWHQQARSWRKFPSDSPWLSLPYHRPGTSCAAHRTARAAGPRSTMGTRPARPESRDRQRESGDLQRRHADRGDVTPVHHLIPADRRATRVPSRSGLCGLYVFRARPAPSDAGAHLLRQRHLIHHPGQGFVVRRQGRNGRVGQPALHHVTHSSS